MSFLCPVLFGFFERPLRRSRNSEDAGPRRSASSKRGQEALVVLTVQGPAMERKGLLKADPSAYKVGVHWVHCVGCDNDISNGPNIILGCELSIAGCARIRLVERWSVNLSR